MGGARGRVYAIDGGICDVVLYELRSDIEILDLETELTSVICGLVQTVYGYTAELCVSAKLSLVDTRPHSGYRGDGDEVAWDGSTSGVGCDGVAESWPERGGGDDDGVDGVEEMVTRWRGMAAAVVLAVMGWPEVGRRGGCVDEVMVWRGGGELGVNEVGCGGDRGCVMKLV
ncbi:hypothetical protein Tco_1368275 [Tanacetum coccineum]